MTTLAERPEIAGGVVSHANGLEIQTELGFNEWKRLMERLLKTTDRALWSLGDARLYGARFEKDYYDALVLIDASSKLVAPAVRVASAFSQERRREQLSFDFHAVVAGLEEPEQERWLNDAERQGWSARQMQLAFVDSIERVSVAAISVRAVGELHELCVRAADKRGMDPKEWALGVLEQAAREVLAA